MEDLKKKRLLLSRKNIGKPLKNKVVIALQNIGINISIDLFIDLEKSDLFLEEIKNLEFTRTDFHFKNENEFRRFINVQDFPENILFFSDHTEYCGLISFSKELLLDKMIEILRMPFFGGYFTIYSERKDIIMEFDLEEEFNLSIYKRVIGSG